MRSKRRKQRRGLADLCCLRSLLFESWQDSIGTLLVEEKSPVARGPLKNTGERFLPAGASKRQCPAVRKETTELFCIASV